MTPQKSDADFQACSDTPSTGDVDARYGSPPGTSNTVTPRQNSLIFRFEIRVHKLSCEGSRVWARLFHGKSVPRSVRFAPSSTWSRLDISADFRMGDLELGLHDTISHSQRADEMRLTDGKDF